jgi:hypothetical protein
VRHKDHSFDIPIDPAAFNLPRTAAGRQNEHIAHFVCSWLSLLLDSPLGTKPVKVFREFLAELYRDFQGVVIQYSELSHRLVL